MRFLKKNHKLIGQNEQNVTKPQKHDANLQKNSTLYFQIGLILCLLFTYGLLEMEFQTSTFNFVMMDVEDESEFYLDFTPMIEKPSFDEIVKKTKPKRIINPPVVVPNNTQTDPVDKVFVEPKSNVPILNPSKMPSIKPPVDNHGPYNVMAVERVPIYPGCEDATTNAERRQCMSEKIARHIQKKFDKDLASELGLSGMQKINVMFRIDKSGNVTDIKAKSNYVQLEKEAKKVISKLPKMTPGMQKDKEVEVVYALPIRFNIRN